MRILAALRRSLVRIRDALDARLHPGRLERARERLRNMPSESILFICLGNVCRSPYAEHVLRTRVGPRVRIESAGFIFPGRPPPEHAVEAAAARGVPTGDHRSQVVTEAMLADADAVFVFDRFNVRRLRKTGAARMDRVFWLGDLDPQWVGKRAIIDPWGKALEDFDRTFARIERCIDEIVTAIGDRERAPATGETP